MSSSLIGEKGAVMFVLYYKEPIIVKEPLRKNCTHQSWRGVQIAMCDDKELLEEYIRTKKNKDQYYIEERPWQVVKTKEEK